jgi:hypothetical protein
LYDVLYLVSKEEDNQMTGGGGKICDSKKYSQLEAALRI